MVPDFYLLAHSHAVCLLDAATDWREKVQLAGGADARFGEAFQGWFDGKVPARPLELSFAWPGALPRSLVAWVMPPGGKVGHLVSLVPGPGGVPKVQENPDFVAMLREWRGTAPIVSIIRGNEHVLTFLNRFPPYDFLDDDTPGVVRGVPILDEGLIEGFVATWADLVFHSLALARREAPGNPLLHVCPPPPREHPERARHLEEIGDVVQQYGFVPVALRLKWYRRYCRHLAKRLAAIGCVTLAAPPAACTPEGLLREEFSEGLTHGNRRYGELLAARLDAWIAGLAR